MKESIRSLIILKGKNSKESLRRYYAFLMVGGAFAIGLIATTNEPVWIAPISAVPFIGEAFLHFANYSEQLVKENSPRSS